METLFLTVALDALNPARIPRRDFTVLGGDDLKLKIALRSSDSAAGQSVATPLRLVLCTEEHWSRWDYGAPWGAVPPGARVINGRVTDDGFVLLRVSGAATDCLMGRWRYAIQTRASTVQIGVLAVLPGVGGRMDTGLFVLDQSTLDSGDVLPSTFVDGRPVDGDGFFYD